MHAAPMLKTVSYTLCGHFQVEPPFPGPYCQYRTMLPLSACCATTLHLPDPLQPLAPNTCNMSHLRCTHAKDILLHAAQPLQAELQANVEQQENHPQLCQVSHSLHILNDTQAVGPYQGAPSLQCTSINQSINQTFKQSVSQSVSVSQSINEEHTHTPRTD